MSNERIPGRVEVDTSDAQQEIRPAREPGRVEDAVVAMAEEEDTVQAQPAPEQKGSSLWLKTLWLVLLTLAGWALVNSTLALLQLWQDYRWLALGLGALSLLSVLYLLRLLYSEWRASKRLDAVAQRQQVFEQARTGNDIAAFSRALDAGLRELQPLYPAQMDSYRDALPERDTVAARMQLAENTWLAELDRQAQALIKQEALTVGAAVALVPHPVLDGVIVLWRSQRLVRKLGQLYGLQPTGLSSWKLLKAALLNTLIVGALDTASELVAEQAGYGLVETTVGKGTVQGVVMNQRMRRLGRQAQQLCRPWQSS